MKWENTRTQKNVFNYAKMKIIGWIGQPYTSNLPYLLHVDASHWVSAPFSHPKQSACVSSLEYLSLFVAQQCDPLQNGNGWVGGQNPIHQSFTVKWVSVNEIMHALDY